MLQHLVKVSERIRDIIYDNHFLDAEDYNPTPDTEALDQRVSNLRKKGVRGKPKGTKAPQRSATTQTGYERDPLVKAWVLDKADGICELCGSLGPFVDKNGHHFLEVHHVVALADDGPVVENAVALCPNCHRECHLSPERQTIIQQLQDEVERIVSPVS